MKKFILCAAVVLTACGLSPQTTELSTAPELNAQAVPPVTLLAAGDIGKCGYDGAAKTGTLVRRILGTNPTALVAALGDLAYPNGTATDFRNCYDPHWGSFKASTRPAPGNHEYYTSGAAPYYAYFGANAGPAGKGYYSFDFGAWHIVSLNSNCSAIGGCAAGSPQEQWLRADLSASTKRCTLAFWHHPLFSSGQHGNNTATRDLYKALYQARAEIVLNGHDHHYERFALQDHLGNATTAGIREFLVGTGGGGLYSTSTPRRNSVVRYNQGYGILKLTLGDGQYSWDFVSEDGKTWTDRGTGTCA
ncbi:metallophosphoesterase family protein [Deinococcus aquaedulcis]|uniref:metallophosphoesterase family protein n=1 Tax=Deinococcus aquaedulcis TaxID=2840455 RepID=UPI002E2E804D|nr:metallophosphoesterase [Deinococcus aquaedulcis]